MNNITSLSETIGHLVQEITLRREMIKADFIKTWLTVSLPKGEVTDSVIKNLLETLSVEEKWSNDMKTVTWSLVVRKTRKIKPHSRTPENPYGEYEDE